MQSCPQVVRLGLSWSASEHVINLYTMMCTIVADLVSNAASRTHSIFLRMSAYCRSSQTTKDTGLTFLRSPRRLVELPTYVHAE